MAAADDVENVDLSASPRAASWRSRVAEQIVFTTCGSASDSRALLRLLREKSSAYVVWETTNGDRTCGSQRNFTGHREPHSIVRCVTTTPITPDDSGLPATTRRDHLSQRRFSQVLHSRNERTRGVITLAARPSRSRWTSWSRRERDNGYRVGVGLSAHQLAIRPITTFLSWALWISGPSETNGRTPSPNASSRHFDGRVRRQNKIRILQLIKLPCVCVAQSVRLRFALRAIQSARSHPSAANSTGSAATRVGGSSLRYISLSAQSLHLFVPVTFLLPLSRTRSPPPHARQTHSMSLSISVRSVPRNDSSDRPGCARMWAEIRTQYYQTCAQPGPSRSVLGRFAR